MSRNPILIALSLALLAPAHLSAAAPTPASEPTKAVAAAAAAAADLAGALEEWVKLLEKNDAEKAAGWAADEATAKEVKAQWDAMKRNHKAHDYRKWIDGRAKGVAAAKAVGDAKSFTVGGHEFGHLYVDWAKSDRGWRISGVRMCR